MSDQSASGRLDTVTKSAVRKTLVTPSSAINSWAITLSVGLSGVKVAGPPTGLPTENLTAFGLGVPSTDITTPFLSPRPGVFRWVWVAKKRKGTFR